MTKLLFLLAVLVIVVLYAIIKGLASRPKASATASANGSTKPGESSIDFAVILSNPLQFSEGELWTAFMDRFREQWGMQIVCAEMAKFSDPSKGIRQFLFTDRTHRISLMHIGQPVGDQMVQLALASSTKLSEAETKDLAGSKASIRVHYHMGESVQPVKQVEMALKVVLSLLSLPESVGYLNPYGQFYNPKAKMLPLLRENTLEPSAIFLGATGVQVTQDNRNRMWMHTHGMEQFGVPDIQIKFDNQSQTEYFHNLIANTALYMMDSGPVLKPGHTAELAGDGIIYRIKAVAGSEGAHFGKNGAIEIERSPQ